MKKPILIPQLSPQVEVSCRQKNTVSVLALLQRHVEVLRLGGSAEPWQGCSSLPVPGWRRDAHDVVLGTGLTGVHRCCSHCNTEIWQEMQIETIRIR